MCVVPISQGDDAAPQSVRVELSSEADLFFHYTHSTDDASFQVGRVLHPGLIDYIDIQARV